MNLEEIYNLIKKAKWLGDKSVNDLKIMTREELINSLNEGTFICDCTNWINLMTFLIDTTEKLFIPLPGVIGGECAGYARYCASDIIVSNALPLNEKGQWIINLGYKWWGMTSQGPECYTLDEWLEISRNKLAKHKNSFSIINKLVETPWIAYTHADVLRIVKAGPSIEQECYILTIKIDMCKIPKKSITPLMSLAPVDFILSEIEKLQIQENCETRPLLDFPVELKLENPDILEEPKITEETKIIGEVD